MRTGSCRSRKRGVTTTYISRNCSLTSNSEAELLQSWRSRVEQARAIHGFTSDYFELVVHQEHEGEQSPDGHLRLRNARMMVETSWREYQRILKIYVDLVIHHRTPPEDLA